MTTRLRKDSPRRSKGESNLVKLVLFDGVVIIISYCSEHYQQGPNLWKAKNRRPKKQIAGKPFYPPVTRIAPEFPHSLAIC
jgi:hypothetical protein